MQIFKSTDNAEGQLLASILSSDLSFSLNSGEGDLFPIAVNGNATSGGSSTALNSTGIGSTSIAVGDIIENVTDGSLAVITTINTNDIVTTELIGGSDNTWDNSDQWAVNRFIVTATARSTSPEGVITITKQEQMLIEGRASGSDIFTVKQRNYDGNGAFGFDADDYVSIFTVSVHVEKIKELVAQYITSNDTKLSTKADLSAVLTLLNAISWKNSVVAGTTANITLASAVENGDTLDGVTLATGDRILIKDQTTASENGIYTVNASGTPTRATDFDESSEVTGSVVLVTGGTVNNDTIWQCTSDDPVIGTDDIDFVIFPTAIASQAEAEAGTDNAKIMTPLRVKQAIASTAFVGSKVTSGGPVSATQTATGNYSLPITISSGCKYYKVNCGIRSVETGYSPNSSTNNLEISGISGFAPVYAQKVQTSVSSLVDHGINYNFTSTTNSSTAVVCNTLSIRIISVSISGNTLSIGYSVEGTPSPTQSVEIFCWNVFAWG